MPTIAFANSKGGVGKSTSAILLATELVEHGTTVTIIDADPNQPINLWGEKPNKPDGLTVVSATSEETLLDSIDEAAHTTAFVIIDLEGVASVMVAHAMSRADLVIIPMKGSFLDGREAAKVIAFIGRQEKAYHRAIPYAVLLTQTNPAVRPRTLRDAEQDLKTRGIPIFGTALHERDAFRSIFAYGGTLGTLDPKQVHNLDGAIANAREFMREVVTKLKGQGSQPRAVA